MTYTAHANRYQAMPYRYCGKSGLQLPAISLGLWHNFGDTTPLQSQRDLICAAFDAGITHFDLANNYGPPAGSAEQNFGKILAEDLRTYRDELVISTKAGYEMWPGPYGQRGGSRKYLLASLDQSLQRMGLDYVDIFYSHCADPNTPLEETMGALSSAVQQGKALYVGISSYSAKRTQEAARILRDMGTPCLIHQPSYSLLNRWIERDLLKTLAQQGIGCIVFSPLAQGLLSGKYQKQAIPADARVNKAGGNSFRDTYLEESNLSKVVALQKLAVARGQSLAQMSLAWCLRVQQEKAISSVLLGASSVAQLHENLRALDNTLFSNDELAQIDQITGNEDTGVDIWAKSRVV